MPEAAPRKNLQYTVNGSAVEAPPMCAGIYRFLDEENQVLYIGKSVNIRNRVRSHLSTSSQTVRQSRMIHAAVRIDCQPTAGEAGALLLENAAIKQQMPAFNRRQRSLRRMWSIVLDESEAGLLQPQLCCFSMSDPDIRSAYGHYANRHQARKALETLARSESLCPRVLGLESGRGACFQHQIGRCKGACVGLESHTEHNARLLYALAQRQLSAWPSDQPLVLHERAQEPLSCQPEQQWHVLHNWMYLGTFSSIESARIETYAGGFMFDRDTHRILRGILRKGPAQLCRLDSGVSVHWPG